MSALENDTAQNRWLRCYHPAPEARATLVCFPHAGGAASYFVPFARQLAPDVRMYAVQYPGRQDRRHEPCLPSVAELAAGVRPLLAGLDGPVGLFGHSLGASVAFEVARELDDDAIAALFVSGRPAPSWHRSHDVHRRDDRGIVAELAKLSGTDTRLLDDPEVLELILPAIRSDYTAAEQYTYRPGPSLSAPIVALHGADDERVTWEENAAWETHTGASFALHDFPGGHFYLTDAWPDLARLVSTRLVPAAVPAASSSEATRRDH
jgi:pyochelin biosynthetic protein PchC